MSPVVVYERSKPKGGATAAELPQFEDKFTLVKKRDRSKAFYKDARSENEEEGQGTAKKAKKRGRPKATASTNGKRAKRRGRPRKDRAVEAFTKKEATLRTVEEIPAAGAKRRGRPRKDRAVEAFTKKEATLRPVNEIPAAGAELASRSNGIQEESGRSEEEQYNSAEEGIQEESEEETYFSAEEENNNVKKLISNTLGWGLFCE